MGRYHFTPSRHVGYVSFLTDHFLHPDIRTPLVTWYFFLVSKAADTPPPLSQVAAIYTCDVRAVTTLVRVVLWGSDVSKTRGQD